MAWKGKKRSKEEEEVVADGKAGRACVSKRKGEAEFKGQRSTNKVNVTVSIRAKRHAMAVSLSQFFLPSSIDILWPFLTSASGGHWGFCFDFGFGGFFPSILALWDLAAGVG